MRFVRSTLLWLACLLGPALLAHPEWKEAYCVGVIEDDPRGPGGDYRVDLTIKFDVPSYLVGKTPKAATLPELDFLMHAPGRLAAAAEPAPLQFARSLRLFADGTEIPLEIVAFPAAVEIHAQSEKQGEADRYPVLLNAKFRARLPRDTSKVEIMFPATLGTVFTNLRRGMDSQVIMTVPAGERGEFIIGEFHQTLGGFLLDGLDHVFPAGWDHALFMVAMMLSAASLTAALQRSLIFTLGHALTLTLVATGKLPPVGSWIEPLIAATIAYGGFLAYRQSTAKTTLLLVPLFFGFIHGLGFAAAAAARLDDLPAADLVKFLLGFNLGVEAAQAGLILATAGLLFLLASFGGRAESLRRQGGMAIAFAGLAILVVRLAELLSSLT